MTRLMLAVMLVVSTGAWAQKAKEKQPVSEVVFGNGTEIGGERQGPAVLDIHTYRQRKFSNLIKVRENFDDKIVKSVDQM